jgi:hypothetical protein
MLRNQLYYELKPLLPALLRHWVRRWMARRKRGRVGKTWPILPGSERPPQGWPGWPGGKQFAFVLTHDVERREGLAKCPELLKVDHGAGLRSSFNFVPEGDYSVPPELRSEIVKHGCEVGVHDLNHDGKLYRTRRQFSAKAKRINHYLKEWGAVGFRSGFMLHNLEWAHELNVQYEASTFDTDPFEPQPDGVGTIFPFWVPHPSPVHESRPSTFDHGGGYVELPYTLPQDSTVFLILGDRHPGIWFEKLDWVARHGGMALINSHPDYMAMSNCLNGQWEYPVSIYSKFLEHVSSRYRGAYWNALPKEVAAYWRRTMVNKPGQGPAVEKFASASTER